MLRAARYFLLLVAFLLFPRVADALTLSPAIFELSAEPGTTQTAYFSLENDENDPQTYYIGIQKFIPKGDGGQQEFLPPTETSGLPSWIYLDRASIRLNPEEKQKLAFQIRVPADAQPGGHYAAIFISTSPPQDSAGGAVTIGARTGMLIFLTVKGTLIEKTRITEFAMDSSPNRLSLPVRFRTMVRNEGNIHVLPDGFITVRNMFGQITTRLALNSKRVRVLPNSERRILTTWSEMDAKEGSGFWHQVREQWRNFAIGPYEATLEYAGDSEKTDARFRVRFAIWPTHLIFVSAILLIGFIAIARFYRSRIISRVMRRV